MVTLPVNSKHMGGCHCCPHNHEGLDTQTPSTCAWLWAGLLVVISDEKKSKIPQVQHNLLVSNVRTLRIKHHREML